MTARTFPARELGPKLVLATAIAPEAEVLIVGVTDIDGELTLHTDANVLPQDAWDTIF